MFLLTLQSLHFSDMIAMAFLHILQCAFALPALGINYYQSFKDFFAKTFFDIRFDFRWKFFTISKSPVSNICYTIRNIYTGE